MMIVFIYRVRRWRKYFYTHFTYDRCTTVDRQYGFILDLDFKPRTGTEPKRTGSGTGTFKILRTETFIYLNYLLPLIVCSRYLEIF